MRWLALLALAACDDGGAGSVADVGVDGAVLDAAGDAARQPDLSVGTPPDAAADAEPDAAAPPAELDDPGPFGVGFRLDEVTYESPEGPRTLRLAVWYPTLDTEGFAARYASLVTRPEVLHDSAPAIEGEAPLMLFSHGSQGIAEQSYFLTEFFASHGWVIVSPDHPGNTFIDNSGPIYVQVEYRPRDIEKTLDHILNLPAEDPLAGHVSDEQILMAGHSFGGYTALAFGGARLPIQEVVDRCEALEEELNEEGLCEFAAAANERLTADPVADPRVKAIISMTPVWARFFEGGLDAIGRPVLLMTGERDTQLPNEEEGDPIWAWLGGPDDIRLDVENAGHLSFSDFCSLLGGLGERVADAGCGADFIQLPRLHRVVKAWSMAFASRHVLGGEHGAALLDGELSLDDAVRVSRKRR